MKILYFLIKCLKAVVNLDAGEAHEKRGGKGGIKILKTYLKSSECYKLLIFKKLW
jgi:hypothetical protein